MSMPSLPDVNQMELQEEFIEADVTQSGEEFFQPPLVDDGEHLANVTVSSKGVIIKKQKDKVTGQPTGPAYVEANLQYKIVDDYGKETTSVFDNPNTISMGGFNRLYAILDIVGDPIKNPRMSTTDVQRHAQATFAQSTQVKLVTQWEATAKGSDGKYYTVAKGMKNFPKMVDVDGNPTGKYDPNVLDSKTGEKVRAQVKVVKCLKVK